MTRKICVLALVSALGALVTLTALAADPPKSGEAAKQEARTRGAALLGEAWRLAEIGEKQQSPEAFVFAGGLLLKLNALTKGELGTLSEKPEVLDEAGKPVQDAKVETEKTPSLENMAQDFFDSAEGLGGKLKTSKEVAALIKATKSYKYDAGTRGSVGGPETISRLLGQHATHHYTFRFYNNTQAAVGFNAAENARFKIAGNGNALYVETGSYGNYTWMPRGGGASKEFDVTIENNHNHAITYRLYKN